MILTGLFSTAVEDVLLKFFYPRGVDHPPSHTFIYPLCFERNIEPPHLSCPRPPPFLPAAMNYHSAPLVTVAASSQYFEIAVSYLFSVEVSPLLFFSHRFPLSFFFSSSFSCPKYHLPRTPPSAYPQFLHLL